LLILCLDALSIAVRGVLDANWRHSIRAAKIVLSLIGRTGKVLSHWAGSF